MGPGRPFLTAHWGPLVLLNYPCPTALLAPLKAQPNHFGCRLLFLPDRTLLVALGDGYDYRDQSQSPDSHLGKIVRITREGAAGRELLVFRHDNPAAGVQVPAGTVDPGEPPDRAVLREAWEESGLAALRIVRPLGLLIEDLPAGIYALAEASIFLRAPDSTAPPQDLGLGRGTMLGRGAYVTLAQTDVKRLIAYSSISHMGFVTLGIFSLDRSGVEGAILQMINHGIITGALFLCIGMIYERTHTREIVDYGGLAKVAPIYSTFLAVFCLAAAGFAGLNSFVGEFLIISGAFKAWPWLGVMGVWGVALGTTYMLWLYYRVALGEVKPGLRELPLELNAREMATLAPLVVLALVIGLYPESVLGFLHASVKQLPVVVTASAMGRL